MYFIFFYKLFVYLDFYTKYFYIYIFIQNIFYIKNIFIFLDFFTNYLYIYIFLDLYLGFCRNILLYVNYSFLFIFIKKCSEIKWQYVQNVEIQK
ncbi:hypothetical protein SDC9_07359 [bioreactor metagenome]|uniref:Uncharacterized protein n=1 Tax=bioreactor metagenome TaxID=1076179 RepID=A0A644T6I9_9ZZZZ